MQRRDAGLTDQAIYHELSEIYFDKKSIALLITGTATKENLHKYKRINQVLVGLLILAVILRCLIVIQIALTIEQWWALLLLFVVPAFAAYFAYEIARYNAPIYRFCAILTVLGFVQSIGKLEGTDIPINLLFAAAIAGLSMYLDQKLFPDFKPNDLKKDENGDFILEQTPE